MLVFLYFRKHDAYPSTSEIYNWSLNIKKAFPNVRDKAIYDSGLMIYPDSADDLPKTVFERYRTDDPPIFMDIPELAGICEHRVRVRSSANGVKHCHTRVALNDPDGHVTDFEIRNDPHGRKNDNDNNQNRIKGYGVAALRSPI